MPRWGCVMDLSGYTIDEFNMFQAVLDVAVFPIKRNGL